MAAGVAQALVAPAGRGRPGRASRQHMVSLQQVDIGSLIANPQRNLAKAEARHKGTVARARKGLSDVSVASARTMGSVVDRDAVALEASSSSLKAAAALARRVADKESIPPSATKAQKHEAWGDEGSEARAALDVAKARSAHAAQAMPSATKPTSLADTEMGLAKAVSAGRAQAVVLDREFSKEIAKEVRAVAKRVEGIAQAFVGHLAPKAMPSMEAPTRSQSK